MESSASNTQNTMESNTIPGDNSEPNSPGGNEAEGLTQAEIDEITSQMKPREGEDSVEYTMRVEKELRARSSEQGPIALTLKELKRKRKYQCTPIHKSLRQYLARAQLSGRIAFGLYLNTDPIETVVTSVFNSFEGELGLKQTGEEEAIKRLKQNYANWKCRTLDNLETAVDIRLSDRKVNRWCRNIYADLAARVKLHIDWRNIPVNKRAAQYEWDRPGLIVRFDTLTKAPKFLEGRPARSDLRLHTASKRGPAKKKLREILDVDTAADPDVTFEVSDEDDE
ncbi:hypothetical protein ABKA04_002918 [Annulohypoxylon sp. FPYF3050]